jgi:hypothetical protein
VDPFAVLGVPPGASERELLQAYRRLAKRWHPDRAGGGAERRMAEINRAYDLARAAVRRRGPGRAAVADRPVAARPVRRRVPPGTWLAPAVRRALGIELLGALRRDEPVHFVVPTSLWASPRATLAVTDKRLLWLLDDAPANRVRDLRFARVDEVAHRLAWPLRRRATLRVRERGGRAVTFADLAPQTAAAIAAHVAARR